MDSQIEWISVLHSVDPDSDHMGESFQDYSWIQDLRLTFNRIREVITWPFNLNCEYLVCILQVLRLEFRKFRILEILNFHPCDQTNGVVSFYNIVYKK